MGYLRRRSDGQVAVSSVLIVAFTLFAFSLIPAAASAQLTRRVYASGFSAPVAFVQDPVNRSVQYVVQQGGLILVVRNGSVLPTPFLDLTPAVRSGGEQGLLGLAFAPDYATSGRFYVNFTDRFGVGNTVIARFKRSSGNPLVADPATRFNLRWGGPAGPESIVQPFTNHNGGELAFGPDGYLYIGLGDGGSANDPAHRAQNPLELLGKILRIDVSVPDGDPQGYRVPADNPFVGRADVRPEIWASGLRNPWRFSFDDPVRGGTGALLIADVGQNQWEEVNYQPAGRGGLNYGWRNREGAHDRVTTLPPWSLPLTEPIHEYSHAFGASITGGFVYRGVALGPAYKGRYFFADFGSGRVWSLGLTIDSAGNARVVNVVDHTNELGPAVNVGSFGVDANGELYIVDYSGRILAIEGRYSFTPADVDGDRRTDLAIWRESSGEWFPLTSRSGYSAANAVPLGSSGDIPLMGDVDGDGTRDLIVWTPSTGIWSWRSSSAQFVVGGSKAWGSGALGDMPLVGDIDGDGRADLIVWRASSGEFFWVLSSSGYANAGSRQWGNSALGDQPLIGDFDGDGRSDLAVWRASTGTFCWLFAADGFGYASARGVQWGNASLGDRPMLADFDGDGRSDLAVWRASTGVWFWITSATQYAYAAARGPQWGNNSLGDVPVIGDFDGDHLADVAVWRASTGTWYWLTSSSGFSLAAADGRHWGNAALGDVPVVK